jgi:hypothetical protein
MQKNRKGERRQREGHGAVRHAEGSARRQPFECRKGLAEGKASSRIIGIEPRDAAIDQQPAKRYDKGLHAHPGDEQAMDQSHGDADQDDDGDGQRPVEADIGDQVDKHDPQQSDDRSDRQLDAARDDDEGLGQREKAEQPDQIGRVGQVDGRQEAWIDTGDDRADDENQQEKTQILFQHRRALSDMPAGRPLKTTIPPALHGMALRLIANPARAGRSASLRPPRSRSPSRPRAAARCAR